ASLVEAAEIVARAHDGFDFKDACAFKLRKPWQFRLSAAAKVSKDKPEIFAGRIACDPHVFGEADGLGRLIDAFATAVVCPTVIEATDAVAFDPADRERGAPMRAARADDERRAALAAIQRKILVHDAQRHRAPGLKVIRPINRLPEHSHVAAGKCFGAGVDEIEVRHRGCGPLSELRPTEPRRVSPKMSNSKFSGGD